MLALEHFGDFNQRHIDLRFDRLKNDRAKSLDPAGAPVTALPLGRLRTGLPPNAHPAHRTGGRHAKPFRCRTARKAARHCRYQS